MATCEFCRAELPNNARFCSNCGKTPQASQISQGLQAPQQVANMRISPMQSVPPPLSQQPPHHDEQNTSQKSSPFIGSKPKWLAGTSPKKLIIGLIIIIIVASGLGVTAAIVRSHLTGTANNTSTPVINPACPNQQSGTCTPTQKNKTPGPGNGRTANLLLSGAVDGRLTSTRITRCGTSGAEYDLSVQGKVGGTQYALVFRITSYNGAGTYSVGQMFASLTQRPISVTTTWATTGTQSATATIRSNTKDGTMALNLSGALNMVHISGSWACG